MFCGQIIEILSRNNWGYFNLKKYFVKMQHFLILEKYLCKDRKNCICSPAAVCVTDWTNPCVRDGVDSFFKSLFHVFYSGDFPVRLSFLTTSALTIIQQILSCIDVEAISIWQFPCLEWTLTSENWNQKWPTTYGGKLRLESAPNGSGTSYPLRKLRQINWPTNRRTGGVIGKSNFQL